METTVQRLSLEVKFKHSFIICYMCYISILHYARTYLWLSDYNYEFRSIFLKSRNLFPPWIITSVSVICYLKISPSFGENGKIRGDCIGTWYLSGVKKTSSGISLIKTDVCWNRLENIWFPSLVSTSLTSYTHVTYNFPACLLINVYITM